MGYAFMIVAGAISGWLAAFVLRADTSRVMPRLVAAGVAGAFLTGLIFTPLVTDGDLSAGTYTVDALLITMAGAIAALMLVNLLHRRDLI